MKIKFGTRQIEVVAELFDATVQQFDIVAAFREVATKQTDAVRVQPGVVTTLIVVISRQSVIVIMQTKATAKQIIITLELLLDLQLPSQQRLMLFWQRFVLLLSFPFLQEVYSRRLIFTHPIFQEFRCFQPQLLCLHVTTIVENMRLL